MLDEECLRPGHVSDETFLNKLSQACADHEHFESRGCRKAQSDKTLPHEAFRLQHYAGAVSSIYGFVHTDNVAQWYKGCLLYLGTHEVLKFKSKGRIEKVLIKQWQPDRKPFTLLLFPGEVRWSCIRLWQVITKF